MKLVNSINSKITKLNSSLAFNKSRIFKRAIYLAKSNLSSTQGDWSASLVQSWAEAKAAKQTTLLEIADLTARLIKLFEVNRDQQQVMNETMLTAHNAGANLNN